MTRNKLRKLKRELLNLRRSPQKAADLESFARGLGRKKETKRGKEPMWVSREFDHLFPAAIPHHGKTSPSAPKTACWINSKRTCGSGNKGSMKKNARNTMMMSRTPKERTMGPAEYLKRPYQRCVVPDSDGSFRGEIVEFPGCIATGETGADALTNLEEVAVSWLETAIAKGLRIPEPMEEGGFSGKLMLRLPKGLHRKAAHAAARDGVSLNQFIVTSVAEQVGSTSARAGVTAQYVAVSGMYFQMNYFPIAH
jgi:predicted RNase H-like HicB family nuclease